MIFLICRKDFRVEFSQLVTIRALLPSASLLALTATASPGVLRKMKRELEIPSAVVLRASPNRSNIYMQRVVRQSDNELSYGTILKKLSKELSQLGGKFPLTLVYAKMAFISMVYRVFHSAVPEVNNAGLRRFAMFHRQTEDKVKNLVVTELGKEKSFIRIVFATQALGMGVDTKHVKKVIHVTPSSSLESYFQEIGRAGRDGEQAIAILHYNNQDIGSNRNNVTDEMKDYCREEGCLRAFILHYFGFSGVEQERCCSNCHPGEVETEYVLVETQIKYRLPPLEDEIAKFREAITEVVKDFNFFVRNSDVAFAQAKELGEKCISDIIDNAEYANKRSYFIKFGIWNDDYLSSIYGIVCKFCPAL